MNLILEYLNYRLTSLFIVRKKEIFVNKVRQCYQKRNEKLIFEDELFIHRKVCRASNRTIKITDFGVGSKKMGNVRAISKIYKTSVASVSFQRLLFQLIKENRCMNVLEMGTSLGFSSVYLSKATLGKVTTIEACPNTAREAEALFSKMALTNVHLIHSTFTDFFKLANTERYDFVYIDGHHDGAALLAYMDFLKPQMKANSIVVVDDIRWSDSMLEAWKKLVNDEYFESFTDLFRMGVLLTKK